MRKKVISATAHSRFEIKWVGRGVFENSDKIWGWFFYNDPTLVTSSSHLYAYAFWARTGKTPSFKRYVYTSWTMSKLVTDKKDRKYNEITVEKTLELWPSFYEDLDNRFVFFMLVGD